MIYLLDVNVLMGLALTEHQFHDRVRGWMTMLDRRSDYFASCALVELGFVRIVPQMSKMMISVKETQKILLQIKATSVIPFTFLVDDLGGDRLPLWVRHLQQTTDGHLLELARTNKAVLATCDRKIPGAFLIPG